MNGYAIESKPLTTDQAKMLLAMLQASTVRGSDALVVIETALALERIANGVDQVTERKEE